MVDLRYVQDNGKKHELGEEALGMDEVFESDVIVVDSENGIPADESALEIGELTSELDPENIPAVEAPIEEADTEPVENRFEAQPVMDLIEEIKPVVDRFEQPEDAEETSSPAVVKEPQQPAWHSQLQDMASTLVFRAYQAKTELVQKDLDFLPRRWDQVLKDESRPAAELMEDGNFISAWIERDLQQALALNSKAQELSENKESAKLGQEFAEQKARIDRAESALRAAELQLSALTKPKPVRVRILQTVITLLFLLAIAFAGLSAYTWLSRQNNSASIYVELATLYRINGKQKEAEDALTKAVTIGSLDAPSWADVGELHRLLGNYQPAVDAYQQAVRMESNNADYHVGLARSLSSLRKYQEAIEQYQLAVEAAPPGKDYMFIEMGVRYNNLKNYEKAVSQFEFALELNPQSSSAYFYMGEAYRGMGNKTESETAFKKAIELKADNYSYYIGFARTYLDQYEYDSSLKVLDQAKELAPERADAFFYAGEAYLGMGNFTKALDEYNQAITINPKSAEYYSGLGDAYSGAADCGNAAAWYSKALSITNNFSRAKQGLATCSENAVDSATQIPTVIPTDIPTKAPTESPTDIPTEYPTQAPTQGPIQNVTQSPTLSNQ